ncbi:MAG: hypothetical protein AVDCRST_MAG76-2986 [uncultured Acidimicrobiales bacterium]|uniref:Uncharacterized protein n=1 Tax=uncultured Acidimicrobiales bacterium TaxID=310071 RepID=A0A6J4IV28_9ACTN|nr:MAG: hypothetical protein AVDCRST_MAG76-2986 [uncultured Acidimicrobiales bacterium]
MRNLASVGSAVAATGPFRYLAQHLLVQEPS